MASTVAREQSSMLLEQQQPPSEIDSESSSGCEDRDPRKRLREDNDCGGGGGGGGSSSSSPKKRRKQTTPVRFPTSLMSTNSSGNIGSERCADSEEETEDNEADEDAADAEESAASPHSLDQHSEGKPRNITPQSTSATTRDENLNSEFRCQFCGLSFDAKDSLFRHIDCEHGGALNASGGQQLSSSLSPNSSQIRVKLEPQSQSDETETPVNLSGLGIKNFAATWLNSQATNPSQISSQTQPQSAEDWSASSAVASVANHLQSIQFPGGLAQYLPMAGFSLGDAGQLPRPPVGPAPIRIFNPDAYCDLCNKEFCNKYFLKTHKANKHGIYVDAPAQSSAENSLAGSLFAGAFATGNVQAEQQIPRLEVPAPQVSASSINTVGCDLCQKRFKNEDSLRKHKQKVHNDSMDNQESHSLPATVSSVEDEREVSRTSPGAMEALFKQEFGVEQEDSKFMPAPRHLSPQSSQQARDSGFNVDRLRRLGVINPEAFCEICCKEYCNKYFLRTHKMKRHGMLVQDSEKSPTNPGTAASWHQIQTSPLNLIVDSNAGSSSESGDRPVEDFECKPCGLRFLTLGIYRAHRAKMHESEEQKVSPKNDYEGESTADQRTDSISEDLQKLQTMILQLNGLDPGKTSTCAICGRECESRAALKSHMSQEHGGIVDDSIVSPSQTTENTSNGTSTFCTLCEKELPTADALRQHITDEHQPSSNNAPPVASAAISIQLPVPPVSTTSVAIPLPSTASVPTPSAQPERKVISMTPTSSYCEICNKELCNKYFMKTHMQRMHNIEIENGSQIGGVICNICNKELCSKYFLRVHKQNTHGIVDEGSTTANNKQEAYEAPSNDDTALKPDQLGDLSHRYFTHFTEVCPICSRRFRSIKWLKAHLLGEHGRPGVDKWRELEQQYQNSPRGGVRSSGTSGRSVQHNQSIKIPNGLDVMQQLKSNDYAGLGNQVLSSLFGSSVEEPAKSYRCSYCSFTTPVLPFLFLHERSHASPQDNNSGVEGSLQCPICSQAFAQPELLHHHLLTRHQFSGLLSQFPTPLVSAQRLEDHPNVGRINELYEKGEGFEGKEDRRITSPQVSSNLETSKSQKSEEPAVQVTPQGAFKCAQCGYATANVNRIRKHIRKDHKTLGDPTDSVIDELSKTLRDVANKHKVPASYAMPQDMNSNPDATVMQPFILEERDAGRIGEDSIPERRFAPALVYLPVRARVSNVLTASFTLSPA